MSIYSPWHVQPHQEQPNDIPRSEPAAVGTCQPGCSPLAARGSGESAAPNSIPTHGPNPLAGATSEAK